MPDLANQLRVETTKAVTTPAWWILAIVLAVVLGGFSVLSSYNVAGGIAASGGDPSGLPVNYLYSVPARMGYLVPLLFGTLIVTAEYRHRTIARSLLAMPSRGLTMIAKSSTALGFGLFFGAIGALIALIAVGGVLAALGQPTYLDDPETSGVVLRTPLVFVLWALIGVGLGFLVRSQTIAIVVVLAFTLILEPVLTTVSGENEWFRSFGRFLPGSASMSIAWPPPSTLDGSMVANLDWWQGSLVLLGYAVAVLVLGYFIGFRNRDVE
ncbi:ABC transporter permease [Agromyces aureus]|uniref:ABC transporter permease n=1 Tax=Agromyces aureus TaxID=453304 RepID=A0A191WBJ3_9MICO|nr:ABC transporter permease [Agromyces aureus]ANJ25626.1 hypothetical protein ATC03_01460 [Agromyces aureus]